MLLQNVFAVKVKRRRAVGQQSGGAVLGVALFHCRRRGKRLEEDTLHLHNASAEHTHLWYNKIKELLTGKDKRIKCAVSLGDCIRDTGPKQCSAGSVQTQKYVDGTDF